MPDYRIEPEELQREDPAAIQRRETLCRKLAAVIQRLALPKSAIEALPDNYAGGASVRDSFRRDMISIAAATICRPGC